MKKLLFITLLLSSLISNGQDFKLLFDKADSAFTELNRSSGEEHVIKIDTIKVKALCSYDYSYSEKYSELKVEPVFVTYLLQIRKHYYSYHPDCVIINESTSIEVIGYLYENGMKLSKIVNVWITKEI